MAHLNVFVRFRPVFHDANEDPEESCVRTSSSTSIEMVNLRNTQKTLKFNFEQVFGEDSTQEEVFGTIVQPNLSLFTDDLHNVSVFAYGPTCSGKTFTILGTDEAPGFIPRTMRHLFVQSRKARFNADVKAKFSMSYIEIYQEKSFKDSPSSSAYHASKSLVEQVYDLLNKSERIDSIRQDKSGNIFLPGLTETSIETFSDFEDLFIPASNNRRVAKTNINERSSRSHTILQIKLATWESKNPSKQKIAKLSVVDLAGSEDNRQTGNKGLRLKESSSINTSLLVLGKVVDSLSKKHARVPYRDSKLTRLLQDSLGGSAHTSMVVNLSPEMSSIFDTHRALTFADKSKSVINRPFTRECVMQSEELEELNSLSHEKVVQPEQSSSDKENLLIEPIFSPFVREQARKRKLQVEKFDGLEKLISAQSTTAPSSDRSHKDKEHQKHLIDDIRRTANIFKVLQTKSKPDSEKPLLVVPTEIRVQHPLHKAPSSAKKSQRFTIVRKEEGCRIEIKPCNASDIGQIFNVLAIRDAHFSRVDNFLVRSLLSAVDDSALEEFK